ncbi:ATP-binding protein [Sulfuricurvum sp. IAE1]|uniref:ATP-binding protein n=1 Tax=Sulfuricurvum sp. IAE1 TaxID=2546102 RepID=UPI001049A02F|nr:ATP-binding protein [Sulfuricurvum sp. IAE1]TDA62493.1 ATP-binding protein [Sulfuricurvum sp. IAE1]
MKKYESVLPNPKNLIHALRDIGYSLETAIADIIDNSITAKASEVCITAHFEMENSYIAIVDNGIGMNEAQLREAMHLGSFDPAFNRDSKDLGRFGLGLKTASFSQAGKLTVISAQNKKFSGRCWNLEHIADTETWEIEVLHGSDIKKIQEIASLANTGTIVLWENLYRLVDNKSKRKPQDIFWEHIELAREHLGLVFHRYLTGESGLKKLAIKINEDQILPFNPFEGAGKPYPEENFYNIKMQAYLLPHHSKTTPEQYRKMAGPDGYLKSQGFYVYRNARLLISGTWFRLISQSEATKLARVQIDLPNSEDYEWSIDVKKSQAVPPEAIRIQLKRTIDKITSQASKVYIKKGKKISADNIVPIWQEYHQHGKKSYKVNIDNPLIKTLSNELDQQQRSLLKGIFDLIENALPIDTIYADMLHEPENIKQEDISIELLEQSAESYWHIMLLAGLSEDVIAERMLCNEPFSKYIDFSESFINKKKGIANGCS